MPFGLRHPESRPETVPTSFRPIFQGHKYEKNCGWSFDCCFASIALTGDRACRRSRSRRNLVPDSARVAPAVRTSARDGTVALIQQSGSKLSMSGRSLEAGVNHPHRGSLARHSRHGPRAKVGKPQEIFTPDASAGWTGGRWARNVPDNSHPSRCRQIAFSMFCRDVVTLPLLTVPIRDPDLGAP